MILGEQKLLLEGFTHDQIREIKEGEGLGLDVSIYAKREFLAIQMLEIRRGLQAGVPVKLYARPEYDWFQMAEIRTGLEDDVDVSVYASPEISYERMREIRLGLMDGINLSSYKRMEAGYLRQLRKAILEKVNILDYIREGYDPEQLEEIRYALGKGLDIAPHLVLEFRGASIHEICLGLESGLDVSRYAKMEYSWRQMREIRLGMINRVDVSVYSDPYYFWEQMHEIRLGLEAGLDVSYYSSLMYTESDMKKRRLFLEEEELEHMLNPQEDTSDNFKIFLSSDEMEAYLEVSGEVRPIDRKEIRRVLRRNAIVEGIDQDMIDKLVEGNYSLRPMLIAKGQAPEEGEDGRYEFFFQVLPDKTPLLLEDGSVDYQHTEWFEMVERGQKLAYYHSATDGKCGKTVTGKEVNAKRGKEQQMLSGKGFVVLDDQKTYLADVSGRVEIIEGRLEITRLLVVENVSLATGNIYFDGSVYVKGNVGSGVTIQATEDVLVEGFVESATIECQGSIVLKQGNNAKGNGYLKADKKVVGKFFEAVKVYAGEEISANYCLNCDLYSEGKIHISGRSGTIAGGISRALNGLIAYNVGNHVGLSTRIILGINEVILKRRKDIEAEIKETKRELTILTNAYEDMQKKFAPEVRNTMEFYLKIENAIYTKEKQQEDLMEEKVKMEELMDEYAHARATIDGMLYEGVMFEVNGLQWKSKQEMRKVTIRKSNNKITVYSH